MKVDAAAVFIIAQMSEHRAFDRFYRRMSEASCLSFIKTLEQTLLALDVFEDDDEER